MKWIKASERMPTESKQYCIREVIHGSLCYSVDFFGKVALGDEFYNRNGVNDFEWLDESPTSLQQESDAVEFVEWTNKEGYTIRFNVGQTGVTYWGKGYQNPITTQQLYTLFTESKQ